MTISHELLCVEEDFCNFKVHFATGSFDKKAPYRKGKSLKKVLLTRKFGLNKN